MDELERFIAGLDYVLDTKRKRHIMGGILLSASMLFGGLALTVMTIKVDEVEIDPDMQNKAEQAREKPDIATYANILKENGYRDYSNAESQKKPEKHPVEIEEDKPYVISPDSFGEMDDYNCISLTYYADGVLADEDDEVVDDVDATVGSDALNHFGEYEDDSVFVRNDSRKCDYEILLDTRNYADVVKKKPRV